MMNACPALTDKQMHKGSLSIYRQTNIDIRRKDKKFCKLPVAPRLSRSRFGKVRQKPSRKGLGITKTHLYKYIENFTSKKLKIFR